MLPSKDLMGFAKCSTHPTSYELSRTSIRSASLWLLALPEKQTDSRTDGAKKIPIDLAKLRLVANSGPAPFDRLDLPGRQRNGVNIAHRHGGL